MEVPVFVNGWLYNSKHRARHGEAGSVKAELIQAQYHTARMACGQFLPENTYNCDEAALFFKPQLERGLETGPILGNKQDNSSITLHFCCNADGSHKLPLWVIGKAANPRSFKAANIQLSALDCVYRNNKKSWMTSTIMLEWLHWFQYQIAGRRVLLIMDNLSAHTLAVRVLQQTHSLENIHIAYLPHNSTSKLQPLDQGIIWTFKAKYRTIWLDYMLQEVESTNNPLQTMNMLKAICWSITAWQAVQTTTILQCWQNSGLIQCPRVIEQMHFQEEDEAAFLIQQLQQLQQHLCISDPSSIEAFIDPPGERIVEDPDDIFEQIVDQYNTVTAQSSEDSDQEEVLPKVSHTEALDSCDKIILYELQQGDGRYDLIQSLEQFRGLIRHRQLQERQQRRITSHPKFKQQYRYSPR